MNSSLPILGRESFPFDFATFTPANIALYGLLAAILPFVYTYTVSTLNSGRPTKDGEPPVPPYWIPFVRHAFALMRGEEIMLDEYRKTAKRAGQPSTVYAFGQKIYLVTDPASILTMWRKSKSISFGPLQAFTVRHIFGSNEAATRSLDVGLVGVDQTGLEGKINFVKHLHEIYNRELNPGTAGLEALFNAYVEELNVDLAAVGTTFTEIELFKFMKQKIFFASGKALYGKKLRLTEALYEDFWKWDRCFLELYKTYPDWMIPGVRAARKRVEKEFTRWRNEVKDKLDSVPDDVAWEENFGARVIRDRFKLTEAALDDDEEAAGNIHMSIFWALEANAIPAACWMLAFTLFTPGVWEQLREEVKQCVIPSKTSSLPTFDLETLWKLPFLNACWMESIRLGVSSLSPRIVVEDTEIDGYHYKKGAMMQGLFPVVQLEEEYWGKDALSFNPSRWLPQAGEDETAYGKRYREMVSKTRPFGGGTNLCPGRHFANQEIVAIVAVLATGFEWDTTGAKIPEVDRTFFGAGGLPAKNDVKVKLRRRV